VNVSRLNDLLRELRTREPALARDLEREVTALADRRAFGLNFERHVPEAVELPGRKVRKGDKVRILPPRGSMPKKADEKVWRVVGIDRSTGTATLEPIAATVLELREPMAEAGEVVRGASAAALDDLVVVAEFRDSIYPGLVSMGKVERGSDKPFHTVINAENFHALETLLFTHRGSVDCIYIDPPYNTGAKDWKYNNDYVEDDDLYRHSKWLAMMERRLVLAKALLNPQASALIVTIDEREYLRLGLLLEQTFPEAKMQMVSSVINRKGVVRTNELTRTNEFIYFVQLGVPTLVAERPASQERVRWASLRRFEDSSRRRGPQPRPDQFYPIYVGIASGRVEDVGVSLAPSVDRSVVVDRPGLHTLWPLKPDGTEMIWGLTPATLRKRLADGFVKVVPGRNGKQPTLYYLTSGQVAEVASGELLVTGRDPDGSVVVEFAIGKASLPTTQWDKESHNAQSNGTGLLDALIPGRRFPYAKSLYAVEDCIRLVVGARRDAVVVDFFAGSGTLAHAVMRLNRQDGGRRRSIMVTNNEVAADEQKALRQKGLRPGDPEWERWGICEYIAKPRIEAAITGKSSNGNPIKGDYKFTDEFPMADGFEENVEFFTLTYEAPLRVASNREFAKIAPLLWMRAGSRGRRIDDISEGWSVADAYGVLADLDHTEDFLNAVAANDAVAMAYIVTDEDRLFESVAQELPNRVEPVRLYEAYLRNFEIESGRGSL
jgi:adenine-specific DNA-methyltransferase